MPIMSHNPRDFWLDVTRNLDQGKSIVHKFGRNDATPNGTWAFVNLLGFTAWPLSAATTVRVKAGGNAADTAAGAGAREVVVQGLDASGAEVQATLATAGASASDPSSQTFLRVHRAFVTQAGTYGGSNTGAVTIENGGGGTDLIQIAAGEGQSQFAAWTCPADHTAYLVSLFLTSDGSKPSDFKLMTRASADDATAPVQPARLKLFFDGVSGAVTYQPRSPDIEIGALTDIWVEARGSGAGSETTANLELLVIEDSSRW